MISRKQLASCNVIYVYEGRLSCNVIYVYEGRLSCKCYQTNTDYNNPKSLQLKGRSVRKIGDVSSVVLTAQYLSRSLSQRLSYKLYDVYSIKECDIVVSRCFLTSDNSIFSFEPPKYHMGEVVNVSDKDT